MTRVSTSLLKAIIILIGLGTLAFLLWEPHAEGVNANATSLFDIYFDDPFLAYAYIASIPFFIALYQAFKLLGFIENNHMFSDRSVKTLQMIRNCAVVIVPFIVGGVVWLFIGESDDRPPIIIMGFITTLISLIVATAATVFARTLQNAVDMKSENELTV